MIIGASWAQHLHLAQGHMSVIIAPSSPHPTPPHWCSIKVLCKVGWTLACPHPTPPHPTPPNVSVASTSCARSRECGRRNVNIPTPPHPTPPNVSVASTSCARSRECGRRNVNIPTPPHPIPPHPMWAHHQHLVKGRGDAVEGTL